MTVQALGTELLDEIPELVDRLVELISTELPSYGLPSSVTADRRLLGARFRRAPANRRSSVTDV